MYSEKLYLYKNRKDVTLTTYVLDGSHGLLAEDRPAVLICPGGAYLKCAAQEGEIVAMAFAAMGYHAFVLRYSTYFGEQVPDTLAENADQIQVKPEVQYPAAMLEVGMALKLIDENAKDWRVDMNRIILCGFSAGAHNVAMFASNWQESWVSQALQIENSKIKPAAVILGYIAGDYFYHETSENEPILQMYSNVAMFGKPTITAEEAKKVAPSTYVTEHMPPTFLWATYEDQTVSVKNTLQMAVTLQEKKVPFELHVFENGEHGLSLATQATAKKTSQKRPDVAVWTGLARTWLEKRFSLTLLDQI